MRQGCVVFSSARYFWPEERLIWTSRLGSRLSTRHRRSVKGVCLLEKGLEFDSPDIKMTELSDGTLLFASFTVRVDLIEVAGSRS